MILAENVVCQGVIDALCDNDITLVLKVKKKVIERLSRMFRYVSSHHANLKAVSYLSVKWL